MIIIGNETYLTVKDIAERISFSNSSAEVARVLRQVQHWTQNDLLETVNFKKTGRGYARLYKDDPTLLFAAVFQELSLYGMTVEILKPISKHLHETYEEEYHDAWFGAMTDEYCGYLQIDCNIDQKSGVFGLPSIEFSSDAELSAPPGLKCHSSSCIVICLNKLASRIRWPGRDAQ